MFRRTHSLSRVEHSTRLTSGEPQRFPAAQNDLLPEPGCKIDRCLPSNEERRQEGRHAPVFDRIDDIKPLDARIDRAYNSHWGSCLREGNENSRFGEQVNDYADLYTSRVSNFGPYSPLRYFRAPRRPMPHEI